MRTTSTTETGPPRETLPPEPPRSGGVSSGLAILAALAVGLLGLLIGFLLFNDDNDSDADPTAVEEPDAEDEATIAELEAERDELAQQLEERDAEIEDLQAELEEVTDERDELQAQLEETDDQAETVEAPDVVGSTVEEARTVAEDNGWIFIERQSASPGGADPGTVVEQYPEPGSPMIEGSVFAVDVAPEPE